MAIGHTAITWHSSSIVLANERCCRTALGGVSLDNAFDLIEGHPPPNKNGRFLRTRHREKT
jgi:hypothetical protein